MNAPPAAERPLQMACEGERLLGILHPAAGDTGVVVAVGGPQYRAGSHRHFVKLARAMAAAGHPVLRFDVRGMGDSSGPLHSFEQVSPDIAAAIDTLMAEQPQVRSVVLWGLCDGASAALLYLHDRPDARVTGLCLLNPWVRSTQSLARTQVKHYYRQRLMQKSFWLKLLSGQVATQALVGLWQNVRAAGGKGHSPTAATPAFQDRMAHAWQAFDRPVLLALSGDDYTAKEFLEFTAAHPAWQGLTDRHGVTRLEVAQADHTLSDRAAQASAERQMLAWLGASQTGGAPAAAGAGA